MKGWILSFVCPHCDEFVELEQFVGECRCWHYGRGVKAAHDCYDSGDCYDYAMPWEEDDEP